MHIKAKITPMALKKNYFATVYSRTRIKCTVKPYRLRQLETFIFFCETVWSPASVSVCERGGGGPRAQRDPHEDGGDEGGGPATGGGELGHQLHQEDAESVRDAVG